MEVLNLEVLEAEVHQALISKLDLEKLSSVDDRRARLAVAAMVQEIVADKGMPLSAAEKEKIDSDLLDEVFGLGPLEALLRDPSISDILVNNAHNIFVERRGLLQKVGVSFRDDRHLMQVIDRIVSKVGRRVDEASPMVDARLPDGSRVNAIIPPLALDGPSVSIRRFGSGPVSADRLVKLQSLSEEMLEVLSAAVKARISILISGGTGAGKTTFLNIMSGFIPPGERLITIEDAAELQLQQQNVVRLETRPPNVEGLGGVRQRHLLINSLRMRPDRIIIGEVRGEEAFDMLQAMNTGHEGSMATIHANTSRDALSRLESMVAMANVNLPERSIRQQISSAITIIVQVSRMSDGTRKVVNISEITGQEENIISMQDIFNFVRRGIGPDGKVVGSFEPSGIRPKFLDRLRIAGIMLPAEIFERCVDVN
ncbi:MAG TPA: CpaF family protein [Bryobacteraceae bacterium]|jgi:pilus assembly protein CpaF|nr:CpaF family protein [Bryobacteraceae bacterium]